MVTPGFPPTRGGVEEHTGRLVEQLVAAGIDVEVLTASRDVTETTVERRPGLLIRRFPAWRTAHLSLSPKLLWAGLRVGRGADLVHVHSYHASTGFAMLGRRGTPLIFTPHYHGTGHSRLAVILHKGYRFVGTALFKAARAVICVSSAEKTLLARDFPDIEDRVSVIPNGVDTQSVLAAVPFADEAPTVLSLGRLEPYKGVAELLRAMPLVDASAQLVVIGEGSQRIELEELAAELGVGSRVRFLGAVDTGTVHRWLRTARVLVSLSGREAFGMAPLEAACAGAKVVLSDIPAYREITDEYLGGVGTLVSGAPAETAAAVNAALQDASLTQTAVPDWSFIAAETIRAYSQVLSEPALASASTSRPIQDIQQKVGSQ